MGSWLWMMAMALGGEPPEPPPASKSPPPPERASVLLEVAPAKDAKAAAPARRLDAAALSKRWREVRADEPAIVVEADAADPTVLAVSSERFGKASLRLVDGPLAGAAEAYKRGLSALITDESAPAHNARIAVELRARQGMTGREALDALAALCLAATRAYEGVGIHFESGGVLQPAGYALAALRDRLPLAWLWVGIELGGTTSKLLQTSRGLARAGLMELELEVERREIGRAIESFFELVALALARGDDFPDGHELARKDAPPFVVRHGAREDGSKVWRIAFPR
jgi:hypothetical protein